MKLSIGFITSRKESKIEWFFHSLDKQILPSDDIEIIVVDFYALERPPSYVMPWALLRKPPHLKLVEPKPSIWQGKHKITRDQWWAKSSSLNTFICLAEYPFIAMVDDRCVLAPQWLQCVRDAMAGNYAVCGSYEKRSGMKVENGEIIDYGECLGVDTRTQFGEPVPTRDWYGGSCALPLEWCLAVQGFPEVCDGLGSEDSQFGVTLANSGFPMKFDSRMRIIEDRTPSEIEGALKRADKNPHLGQKAKSWDIVRMFRGKTTSQNEFDIRNMRARVLNGEPFPPPTGSHYDFYDGQYIGDMT